MLIMKRRNGGEWKGKNDIRCQGTMENWDVEIFTFLSLYGFLYMVHFDVVLFHVYKVYII